MSKVLVTGSSGFIASHLIPALLKTKYTVVGVDRLPNKLIPKQKGFTFKHMDIAQLKNMKGFDYVIHLTMDSNIHGSIADPVGTTYNDLYLSVKMLELAKQAGVKKFIYPSSATLYSTQPTPWKENLPVITAEPYSLQKAALEKYCQYYAQNGLPTVVFRLFQVFGENQRVNTALGKWFQLRAEGKPLTVAPAKRDFIYAGDIAQAIIKALKSPKVGNGEIINISSGHTYTMLEVAKIYSDKIEDISQKHFETSVQLGNIQKAKLLLNWAPKTDIKIWLKKYLATYDHPSQNLSHVQLKKTAAVSRSARPATSKSKHKAR
jgi:nucleoside-diphosphate-sugar epimerase